MDDTHVIRCAEQPVKLHFAHRCPLCGSLFAVADDKATSYTDANTGNVYSLLCDDCTEKAKKIKCGVIEGVR